MAFDSLHLLVRFQACEGLALREVLFVFFESDHFLVEVVIKPY